jgi:uncharacterized protein with FMN-binding domain
MRNVARLLAVITALSSTSGLVAAPAALANRTVQGASYSAAPFGRVQVTITVSGHRITAISSTYPTHFAYSRSLNKRAVPRLKSEALAAQSSQIHIVSGATYTSKAFKNSLHSAMHTAGLS